MFITPTDFVESILLFIHKGGHSRSTTGEIFFVPGHLGGTFDCRETLYYGISPESYPEKITVK